MEQRERQRKEAEEARRTQSVATVHVDNAKSHPPPRRTGNPSLSVADKNLQKKLNEFFGPFEAIYPYVAKDENHVRIVGVTGAPPTPCVSEFGGNSAPETTACSSSSVAVNNSKADTHLANRIKNQTSVDDRVVAVSKNNSQRTDSSALASTSATVSHPVGDGDGIVKCSKNDNKTHSSASSNRFSSVHSSTADSRTAANGNKSKTNADNKDKTKEKRTSNERTLQVDKIERLNNASSSSGYVTNASDQHERHSHGVGGGGDDYSCNDIVKHKSTKLKTSIDDCKKEGENNRSKLDDHHRRQRYSSGDDNNSGKCRQSTSPSANHRREAATSKIGPSSSGDDKRAASVEMTGKKLTKDSLSLDNSFIKKRETSGNNHLVSPRIKVEHTDDIKLEDQEKSTNQKRTHTESKLSSPHCVNSLIKKVKDILVPPLSGIAGTPYERNVFTFPEKTSSSDDNVNNAKSFSDKQRTTLAEPTSIDCLKRKDDRKSGKLLNSEKHVRDERNLCLSEDDDDEDEPQTESKSVLDNKEQYSCEINDTKRKEAGFGDSDEEDDVAVLSENGSSRKNSPTTLKFEQTNNYASSTNILNEEATKVKPSPDANLSDNDTRDSDTMSTSSVPWKSSKQWNLNLIFPNFSAGESSSEASTKAHDKESVQSKHNASSIDHKTVQMKYQENRTHAKHVDDQSGGEKKKVSAHVVSKEKNEAKIGINQQSAVAADEQENRAASKSYPLIAEVVNSKKNENESRKKKKLKSGEQSSSKHNSKKSASSESISSSIHNAFTAAEPVSGVNANVGFVDTGSPGKENYSNSNSAKVPNGCKTSIGDATKIRRKYSKNAEAILQASRLSPLLSPIHEFPPFEYRNGLPSLMCRLPLNLLTRIPADPSSSKNCAFNQRSSSNEKDLYSSCLANSETSGPTSNEMAATDSSLSPPPTLYPNDVASPPPSNKRKRHRSRCGDSPGGCKDLDDVPISERRKKLGAEKKIEKDGYFSKFDKEETAPQLVSMSPIAETKMCSSVDKTIDSVASSSLIELDKKIKKKPSKRKLSLSSTDEPPVCETKSKKAHLDPSYMMSFAPDTSFVVDCNVKDAKYYMDKAKAIKHQADAQGVDRSMRMMMYLESIIYFFLTGYTMEKTLNKESQRPFAMIKDTHDLLKNVTQKYISQVNELSEVSQTLFASKIEVLSLRLQALLCCQMFSIKQSSVLTNYRHINEYQKNVKDRPSSVHGGLSTTSTGAGESQTPSRPTNEEKATSSSSSHPANVSSTPSPTPSPASSTGSSSHSLPPGLVAIPQQMEILYKQQLSYLHNLVLAHHSWQSADGRIKQHDYVFFNRLDSICRPLTLTSPVPSVCLYVLTATHWLKQLYNHL